MVILLLSLTPLQIYAASPSVNVSNNSGDSTNPRVSANMNNVYVVWQDMTLGHLQVFLSVSRDTGATFSPSINLSNDAGNAQDPHIATRGSHVYVVWQDSTPGHVQIFYSISRDSGATWSIPINLSNDLGAALHSRIIATKTDVFIAWTDNTLGHDQLMLAASHDNGATFGAAINLSNDAGYAQNPSIVDLKGNVYVVWQDNTTGNYQVMFRASVDNGTTFNPPINLSNDIGTAIQPVLAAHGKGGDVNVVWQDNTSGHYQIMVISSHDAGASWNTPINLSSDTGDATNPAAAARGSNTGKNVFVAWQDTTPGNSQIFATTSTDNGRTWSTPLNVSNDASTAINARIQNRAGSSNVYVVWTETLSVGGASRVKQATSTDLGQTYGAGQQVNQDSGNAIQGRLKELGSTGTAVYAVWADNASGNYDIYLSRLV